jgi:hypothetical protein
MAVLYIPEYQSFSANCVHNEKGLNGTFISRHIYEFAYNFAASEGNGIITKTINDYNAKVVATCSSRYGSSDNEYNNLYAQMMQYNDTIQVSACQI